MTSQCPSDATFQDWLARDLARPAQLEIDEHVDSCAACRARMVLVARTEQSSLEAYFETLKVLPRDSRAALSLARRLLGRAVGGS